MKSQYYQLALGILQLWKRILPEGIRPGLNRLWVVRWLRLSLLYHLVLKDKLRVQLAFNSKSTGVTDSLDKRILVPLIETDHYQHYQMLVLAKALELRGVDVRVLLCGSRLDGCEIKNFRNADDFDPCLTCRFNHQKLIPHFNLQINQLSDFVSKNEVDSMRSVAEEVTRHYPQNYLFHGIDLVPMINDSVTRFYYGDTPQDNSTEIEVVRRQHLLSAMISTKVASRLLDKWKPDVILSHMQVYSAWAPYYEFYKNHGIRCSSVGISSFNFNRIVFSHMEYFHSNERYKRFLVQRTEPLLNESEKTELHHLIDSRFSGEQRMFKEGDWYDATTRISEVLPIDPLKRNIFLPSNMFWDKGLEELEGLFDGVIDWVVKTIELIKDRSDIHLYIKPHPAEIFFASAKGVADIVRMRYPVLPANVTLVMPEFKISPYELMPFMDVGVLYSGTLGIEMMLRGMPVIVAGQTPYRGLGFASEPKTLNEYRDALLGASEIPPPSLDQVELFAYFYFIKALIPWTLTEQVFKDKFEGYTFDSLDDLLPGKNKYLDHLCNCILDPENTVVEGWS
jgi:hypothetical protein